MKLKYRFRLLDYRYPLKVKNFESSHETSKGCNKNKFCSFKKY